MQDRDPKIKLIDHLQDAWAFENRLLDLVLDQVNACQDRVSRRLYREHALLTRVQRQRIEQRLKALAERPDGGGGWFTARLNRLASEVATMDIWRDESTQLLVISYGIKQVECALYRSLLELARSTPDQATVRLARTSLEEEEATALRLLLCIGSATRSKAA